RPSPSTPTCGTPPSRTRAPPPRSARRGWRPAPTPGSSPTTPPAGSSSSPGTAPPAGSSRPAWPVSPGWRCPRTGAPCTSPTRTPTGSTASRSADPGDGGPIASGGVEVEVVLPVRADLPQLGDQPPGPAPRGGEGLPQLPAELGEQLVGLAVVARR